MKTILLPLASASLLLFTACGSSSNADSAAATSSADAPGSAAMSGDSATGKMDGSMAADSGQAMRGTMASGGADASGPTAPHANDAEFMQSAAHSDQNEIQFSQLALAKGVSGQVKTYANQMIADHTKSTANLKPVAAKAGVTLPTDMDADHKAMLPAMQKLSGKAFETKYVQQMVADHQKTANTLKAHQAMTKNANLQKWITTTLPVVEGHLSMAQQDAKSMGSM